MTDPMLYALALAVTLLGGSVLAALSVGSIIALLCYRA